MNEIIGGLGLVPNVAAAIWLIYGGWKLAMMVKNGGKEPSVSAALEDLRDNLSAMVKSEREILSRLLEDAKADRVEIRGTLRQMMEDAVTSALLKTDKERR